MGTLVRMDDPRQTRKVTPVPQDRPNPSGGYWDRTRGWGVGDRVSTLRPPVRPPSLPLSHPPNLRTKNDIQVKTFIEQPEPTPSPVSSALGTPPCRGRRWRPVPEFHHSDPPKKTGYRLKNPLLVDTDTLRNHSSPETRPQPGPVRRGRGKQTTRLPVLPLGHCYRPSHVGTYRVTPPTSTS